MEQPSLQSLCNEILNNYDTTNAPQTARLLATTMRGFLVAARGNDQLYRECFMTLLEFVLNSQYRRLVGLLLQDGALAVIFIQQLPLRREKHVEVYEMDYNGNDRDDCRVHTDGHYYGNAQCREPDCTQCYAAFALPPVVEYMQMARTLGDESFNTTLLSSAGMTVRNYCVLLPKPALINALRIVVQQLFDPDPPFNHEAWFGEEQEEAEKEEPVQESDKIRRVARHLFRYLYELRYTIRLAAVEEHVQVAPALKLLLDKVSDWQAQGRLPRTPVTPYSIIRRRLHDAFVDALYEIETTLSINPKFPLSQSNDQFRLFWYLYNGARSLYTAL
jgi:hypothetical protein